MNDKFYNLDADKKERILSAAYKEFTEKKFEQASTNRIVKNASIGKGMLFYYFNSKKELYYYLIDHGIKFIKERYLEEIDENMGDFIEKCKQGSKVKLKAYTEKPYIFNFFATSYLNKDMTLSDELEIKLLELRQLVYEKIYRNIDKTLFREDIDPGDGIRLIRLSMDGYEKELLEKLKGKKITELDTDIDPYWEDFYNYLDLLKKILYK
ncbi:TetR/AcrR family transcriptional regulator [Serpentinicella sp. ANB-PHB4]|uniref:TetR/AcrR family transcriptional regulator n=1 Tax=Serpentinicella sp. ANB-PHB4 TaxID=3074076 RepID=UPI0028653163|nr:TetR/AcrR family transcriptional regulator [Serpentinicella sp. ANB-PHB4]MDR5658425.1 TetR/AcrR family transcriptional regulator [Serpentinicella sp. ANB-PHB4]